MAAVRRTARLTLVESGTVVRASLVADGAGGQVETWAPVGTAAMRTAPRSDASARERALAEAVASDAEWILTFEHGTDVTAKDRIHTAGRVFEVAAVFAPRTFATALRVAAAERLA